MRRLFRGGTLVTMNPVGDVLRADLLVDGDTIAAIGDLRDAPADDVVDATGRVIMPGLIQTHIHLAQTLFRGQGDDLELMDWLQQRILPLEAAHDEDSIYYSALLGTGGLLLGGTTSIIDMETVHHTDAAFHAIAESGIRAISGKVMMDTGEGTPPALLQPTDVAIQESLDLAARWNGQADGRIRYAFCPRFAITCTDRLLRQVAELAQSRGLHVHSHASENRGEIAIVEAERGMRNVVYLEQVGLCRKNVVLAHCVHVNEAEIDILAGTGTHVAHCPSSNLKLASGIAPIPQMLRRGVNVSLGADGAACNNNLDAFGEMRAAALIQKPFHGPTAMDARTVLEMATIRGARAMGLEQEIGSLEVGKRADLIMVDLGGLHTWPEANVVSTLVYAARSTDVALTMVDGRILMHDRHLTTLDADRIRQGAAEASRRLLRRIGSLA